MAQAAAAGAKIVEAPSLGAAGRRPARRSRQPPQAPRTCPRALKAARDHHQEAESRRQKGEVTTNAPRETGRRLAIRDVSRDRLT